jgi:formate/nitrite transporter FocA (FNT family)
MPEKRMTDDELDEPVDSADTSTAEKEAVEEASHLSAKLVYAVVRKEGQEEIRRPVRSLVFSGLAAGICIAFSLVGEATLLSRLGDAPWVALVSSFGYSFGFLIVIVGRMQLFTENTITTVLPVLARPSPSMLTRVARLWGIVLCANVVGAAIAAAFIVYTPVFGPEMHQAIRTVSAEAVSQGALQELVRGIPAGLLIAALVWMLASDEFNDFLLIVGITWLISAAGFTHIIVGSVEMMVLVLEQLMGPGEAVFGFFLPALVGNVFGGTVVFALLTWGQVRDEVHPRGR